MELAIAITTAVFLTITPRQNKMFCGYLNSILFNSKFCPLIATFVGTRLVYFFLERILRIIYLTLLTHLDTQLLLAGNALLNFITGGS